MRAVRTPERDRELGKVRRQRYVEKHPAENTWRHLKRRADAEGVACMTVQEFAAWYAEQPKLCVYCGMDAAAAIVQFRHGLHVDRNDGVRGYVGTNISLACHRCNVVKSKYLTYKQMKEVAARYFNGHGNGNAHDDLLTACEAAKAHIEELRDAWQRGIMSENDDKGGTRSNRNVDVDVMLRAAIAKATGG